MTTHLQRSFSAHPLTGYLRQVWIFAYQKNQVRSCISFTFSSGLVAVHIVYPNILTHIMQFTADWHLSGSKLLHLLIEVLQYAYNYLNMALKKLCICLRNKIFILFYERSLPTIQDIYGHRIRVKVTVWVILKPCTIRSIHITLEVWVIVHILEK